MRRCAVLPVFIALLAACHPHADDTAVGDAPANFTPPTADATPAPVRVIDSSVIHDLAAGKTEGVYLYDARRAPAALRSLVFAERAEAFACDRAAGDGRASACARRNELAADLKRHGLCWGPDAEPAADKRWMHRGAGCRD